MPRFGGVPAGLLAAALLAGCAHPSAPPSDSPSPAAASSAAPTTAEWCAGYSAMVKVLATNGTDPSAAATALATLDRFDLIWSYGERLGLVTTDEAAANRRAVSAYRQVLYLIEQGDAASSAAVTRATANLTAITNADRALLMSSAAKVRATCGTPSG